MGNQEFKSENNSELRKKAEEILQEKEIPQPEELRQMSAAEIQEIFHELQVHQIELEIQNEELRQTQLELEEARARYYDLYNLAPVGYCTISQTGEILKSNLAASDLLGEPRKSLINDEIFNFILSEDQDNYYFFQKKLFETGQPQECELRMSADEGTPFWVWLHASLVSESAEKQKARIVLIDINERKEKEKELQFTNFSVENAPLATFWITEAGKFDYVNKTACEMLNYSRSELIGTKVSKVDSNYPADAHKNYWENLKKEETHKTETKFSTKTGENIPVQVTSRYLEFEGQEYEFAFAQDISELKKKEEELKYKTFHDNLTDLYNRIFMQEEMKRLDVPRQLPISIIMSDINGLKIINDSFGHKKGDQLIKKAGHILKDSIRQEDILARYGGDEFVILLPQTTNQKAQKIIDRIKQACKQTEKDDFSVSLGLGIATKNDTQQDIKEVLAQADTNMYQNKLTSSRSKKNKIVQSLISTLEAKSSETKDHAVRLTDLAYKLGKGVGVSNSDLNKLSLLATLHDIGKTSIPEQILTKSGNLTKEEWKMMKKHPQRGYNIVSASDEFSLIAQEVLAHHERWDGKGYPRGLKEKEIPFLARIISIVDAYDVMISERPYSEAISKKEALEEIKNCAGSQFDPELAEKFVEIME